jgi:hypothetical protein
LVRLSDDDAVREFVRDHIAPKPVRVRRMLVRPEPLWRWVPLALTVLGGLTVVQVGTAAIDHFTSPRIGEACVEHRDCGPHELCLRHLPLEERYCSHGCAVDGECPNGMSCGDLSAIPEANRGVGAAGPASVASSCVR